MCSTPLKEPRVSTSPNQIEIVGTLGTLRWDNADGSLGVYRAAEASWQTLAPPEGFERNWMFIEEMRHFLAVVRGEAIPRCTLDDGIRTLEIAVRALSKTA